MPRGRLSAGEKIERSIRRITTKYMMVCACGYREGPWSGKGTIRAQASLHLFPGVDRRCSVEVYRTRFSERIDHSLVSVAGESP
ncbi:MAG: hypothetical protein ACRD1P_06950 [Thermoanaerobaculia bacterium]